MKTDHFVIKAFLKQSRAQKRMKHTLSVTAILLLLFLGAQFMGIAILRSYIDQEHYKLTGEITFRPIFVGGVEIERPQTEGSGTIALISIAVLFGTLLMFLLIYLNWQWVWKLWFVSAIAGCLAIAWSGWLPHPYPLTLGWIAALWRTLRPNPWIHNLTELFIYGGLAVIFVPLLDVTTAVVLLILISLYDAYAVWKSQHMVKLAVFQSKAQVFAGMVIPYKGKMTQAKDAVSKVAKKGAKQEKIVGKSKIRSAILGGGDIGFPLFFTGAVMKSYGDLSLIIPLTTTIALAYLFYKGEQNKFYPAMPYLSVGCFAGLAIIEVITRF